MTNPSNAALSSRTTHGHPEAADACRYLAGLIVGALQGRTKEELALWAFANNTRAEDLQTS